jgi:hypothetical protein
VKSHSTLRLLPRIQDIFFLSIFAAVLLLGSRMLNLDGDLPRHLLMGRYIVEHRTVPTTEIFVRPYLNQPYVTHEWLADVLFYLVDSVAGLAGLVVLSALLMAATFTLLYNKLSTRLSLRLPVLLLVGWGAIATSVNWSVRPHLVSMCLLAIWLLWADDLRRGEQVPFWRFPLLMLVWSNLHGEFIAGILVLLAYSAGWVVDFILDRPNANLLVGKKLWLALLSSIAATLLTPSGIGPWVSILGFVNNRYLMSRMVEANAPNFQNPEMRILFGLLLLSIFLLAIKKDRLPASQGLLLAGFSAMGLVAIRNVHLYGIVAPYVLAETLGWTRQLPIPDRLETILQRIEGQIRGIGWIIVPAALMSVLVLFSGVGQKLYQFEEPTFPVRAMTWLEQNPQSGNMFNKLEWGGYLALHLWPGQLTFIDSVADTTGELTMQYESVVTLSDNWQTVLEQNQVEWAVIASDSRLSHFLEVDQGWQVLYRDEAAVVLRR